MALAMVADSTHVVPPLSTDSDGGDVELAVRRELLGLAVQMRWSEGAKGDDGFYGISTGVVHDRYRFSVGSLKNSCAFLLSG